MNLCGKKKDMDVDNFSYPVYTPSLSFSADRHINLLTDAITEGVKSVSVALGSMS